MSSTSVAEAHREIVTPWPATSRPEGFDILVASKQGTAPRGLQHVPGESRLFIDSRPGWASAANALLEASTRDVLFMDDDVEFYPHSLAALPQYWDKADIFGFTLIRTCDRRIQTAGVNFDRQGKLAHRFSAEEVMTPAYVGWVTASCMIVKRRVIEAGVRFPLWPGLHHEDIAFNIQAWLSGFKVAYLPGMVRHDIGEGGVGNTKIREFDVMTRIEINVQCLEEWKKEVGLVEALLEGRVPLGDRPLP